MPATTRRVFMLQLAAAGSAVAATPTATTVASAPADAGRLDAKDPKAVALGYVTDSAKANQTLYPQHTAAQKCALCQLYQGKAGDAFAPCPIFNQRLVAASGWCSTFIKKAG